MKDVINTIVNYGITVHLTVPMLVMATAVVLFFVLNKRITGGVVGAVALSMLGVINF